MTYDIITIGDAMEDIFIFPDLEEMEKPVTDKKIQSSEPFEKYLVFGLGDKITVSDVSFSIGGTAANVAAGLRKLGLKTAIVSAVGADASGAKIISHLRNKKIGIELIKTFKNKKTSFSVIVSYKGERTIFVYHSFLPENFTLPQEIKASWVYLGPMAKGHERIYNQIVGQVVKHNLQVALNPGAYQLDHGLESFGGLKELINVIFLNREEAQTLAGLPGVPQVKDLAKIILLRGPSIVVITCGKEGAYAYDGDDFFKVGAYPGHRLDATGAGDSFAAGFLAGMMAGNNLLDSLKWGVTNAASVIEKIGAQEGQLGQNMIKRRVKEYRWPANTLRFS